MVFGSEDKILRIYNIQKGKVEQEIPHEGPIKSCGIGENFVATIQGPWLRIFKLRDNKVLSRSAQYVHTSDILSIRCSGKTLIITDSVGAILIFNLRTVTAK